MKQKAEKVRALVRLGISETTELHAAEGTKVNRRAYSLAATKFGWRLLL